MSWGLAPVGSGFVEGLSLWLFRINPKRPIFEEVKLPQISSNFLNSPQNRDVWSLLQAL
jgi:hypothetical protein